jgi:tetratricopeptide (TPR) repeat protein
MKPYRITRITLFLPVFLLLTLRLSGQGEEKIKNMFVEAESYFLFEEYKDALPLYQKILQADPENFNINYKIGICYLNDVYQVQKAIPYLEKAVKGISSSSKTNSLKEKMAPPEAFYYLGNAYRANNRLKDATEAYEQFKLVLDPAVYDIQLVDDQIEACKVAGDEESKPMYYTSLNLGEPVNERFEEINPVVSGDETVIAFTRKLQFYDAVFCSRKVNGKWSDPVNLTEAFGVDGNSYTTGISYKGDEIYVYRSDNFDGNLYVSKYKNGTWSKLEKLNSNINTKYWESHASVSKDGRTLYFTSNRAGGYGGLDIYKSERKKNGDWGPALNLGPVINSKYNEDTPFITADGNTLYYSSMGHYNMGGYDIFYSTRLDNGQWAKPINAGYPLNTTNDDLFFDPVGDGAFAYMARYSKDDSYGMMDIYKLEVFTDLHPRKFILKGMSRMEGHVTNPDFTKYTAVLVNTQTGKVIDEARLNADGSYSLDALAGNMELQIKGKDIQTTADKINIPANSPSDVITHNSVLTAAAATVTATTVAAVAPVAVPVGPELKIGTLSYNVTTNQPIPIRMDLEKDTKLKIENLLNGENQSTELFDIKKKKFVYLFTPRPGNNLLRITLTDKNGNTTVKEVSVIYTPSEPVIQASNTGDQKALNDADRYKGLALLATGSLARFLDSLDRAGVQFNSLGDMYDYLVAHAAEQHYSVEEVDQLMAKFLSQKDLNYFYDELKKNSSDSLVKSIGSIDFQKNRIYTSEALVDYLYKNVDQDKELRESLYKIAAANHDPASMIALLRSFATPGQLADVLDIMQKNAGSYPDTRAIADYLMNALDKKAFTKPELELVLMKAAADLDVNFLYQSLLFISSDPLRNTLYDINLTKNGIINSEQLIASLLQTSATGGYQKREVIDNIEKIRKDPYYYVDMFKRILEERATGSLKVFLHEIDVRHLDINTFEELIDYLLNQSQFHDFNREMVYQLMLDIIGAKNVNEFIELFLKNCDDRMATALHAANPTQFSKPIEVIQYLLSVADEYHYTERDIMRVLLKMLFRKGASGLQAEPEKTGWFALLDKPALVTTLVIVNAIIILMLIVFLIRKKKKNEENGSSV